MLNIVVIYNYSSKRIKGFFTDNTENQEEGRL